MKVLLSRMVLAVALTWFTPSAALSLAIYDAEVILGVSAPFPIPPGTGISLFQGTSDGFEGIVGAGVADFFADATIPGAVQVSATGSASAPPDSAAVSSARANSSGSLLNTNAAAVMFPILISGNWRVAASAGPMESASAAITYSVLFDGLPLVGNAQSVSVGPGETDVRAALIGGGVVNLLLAPGVLHQLTISAEARGQAEASAPVVPEPSTLLLGLAGFIGGAARAYRRRRQCA